VSTKTVLWWGRFDPDYSRNRILRQVLVESGWRVESFSPRFSRLGDFEAALSSLGRPDLIWVPCFRQRDLAAAGRFSRRHGIPLLADPLISAYDKQVFERQKLKAGTRQAQRLLQWERGLFAGVNCLLADTKAHADFFHDILGVEHSRIVVVPVGAEETLFKPTVNEHKLNNPIQILFFGSFIPLQGPRVIVEAARKYCGPKVEWHLLGDGPLLSDMRCLAEGNADVFFEPWIPYAELPERIAQADILLGIFGGTPKACRVVPNKVYQASACGRPVVTMISGAYPDGLLQNQESGFFWVRPDDAQDLAKMVRQLAENPEQLQRAGQAARVSYENYLSEAIVRRQLAEALKLLGFSNS